MAVGDMYRLTIHGRQLGTIRANDAAFQVISATDPTAAQRTALADDFKTVFLAAQLASSTWETWDMRQLWGANMTTIPAECRRDGALVFAGPLSAPLAGTYTGAGDILPPQCALVITLLSGVAGRRRRGRWYAWGMSENQTASGQWDTTTVTDFNTRLATFLAKYGPSGTSPQFQLMVWSERQASGCVPKVPPPGLVNVDPPHPETAATPVTAFQVRNVVYTQRRRVTNFGR